MICHPPPRKLRSTLAALLVGTGLAVSSLAALAEAVTLSYSPWLPPGYVTNKAIVPWMEQVEEVTEGRVKIVPRAAGVGAPREQFDVVRDGLADVSLVIPGYTPGRFPLMEVAELPLLADDPEILSPAVHRLYEQHLAEHKPFAGTHPLTVTAFYPAHLITRSRGVESVDDLRGLKLYITNAPVRRTLGAFGTTPLTASVAELHSMVATGIIDGGVLAFDPTVTWNLHSYLNHATRVRGGMGQATFAILVNERKWSSISEKDRVAIMAISGEVLAAELGKVLAEAEREAAEALEQAGVTITEVPPSVVNEVAQRLAPVEEEWFDKAREVGLSNPEAVLAELRADIEAARKAKAAN